MSCTHGCAGSGDGANDEGNGELTAGHIADLGGVVDDLVHGQEAEVDSHQLHHRAEADHSCAHAGAHDNRLGQWRVFDAAFAVPLVEAFGDGESPTIGADVFTHEENALVLIKGFTEYG